MSSFTCPFCGKVIAKNNSTYTSYRSTFYSSNYANKKEYLNIQSVLLEFNHCPICDFQNISATYMQGPKQHKVNIFPVSMAKQFPDYIPLPIREDYEEAYAIKDLSPKASATLSRRCLQGMIRDFWNITKSSLYQEISELKDKIPSKQWDVLNGIRNIGNIGAHMEKDINTIVDIDPNEAERLIRVIELLIEKWYVARHDEEALYDEVIALSDEKNDLKHQ